MRPFILAAAAAVGLALVSLPAASAAPIAPIGQAAVAVDARTPVYYYGYRYRYHHHRHCWWRHGYRVCRWW